MSLITQCPACSTMFRVVPDQLRISEGWVRCGQCDEVFDANAHLRSLDEALGSASPVSPPSPPMPPEVARNAAPVPASQSDTLQASLMPPMPALSRPAYDWGPGLSAPEPEPESEYGAVHSPSHERHTESTLEGQSPKEAVPAFADSWSPTLLADVAPQAADPEDVENITHTRLGALPEDPPPSFMAADRKLHAPGPLRGSRILLTGCVVLLVLLLFMQVLVQERDRIAAASPSLQPWVVAGCEVLVCSVSAPREIESISIDSSAFTSVRPGVYLLHVNLKNAAGTALAIPALELTLTDAQDRPLLRRVVLPAELSAKPTMAAAAELGASLPIRVTPSATPEKIAGYKLLAFYP